MVRAPNENIALVEERSAAKAWWRRLRGHERQIDLAALHLFSQLHQIEILYRHTHSRCFLSELQQKRLKCRHLKIVSGSNRDDEPRLRGIEVPVRSDYAFRG